MLRPILQTLEEFENTQVTALHMSSEGGCVSSDFGHILVGCSNGDLIDWDGTKSIFHPADLCSRGWGLDEHGEINGLHYEALFGMLIIGFASGRVHVVMCSDGVRSGLENNKGLYCFALNQGLPWLHALQCVYQPPSPLEVWCGSESDQLEVWFLSPGPDNPYTLQRDVITVSLSDSDSSSRHNSLVVRRMHLNHDSTQMVVLLQKVLDHAIAFVDVNSHVLLKIIQCTSSEP